MRLTRNGTLLAMTLLCSMSSLAVACDSAGSMSDSDGSSPTTPACSSGGFDIALPSFVPGSKPRGAASPLEAVFDPHSGRPPGYGSQDSTWVTVSETPDTVVLSAQGEALSVEVIRYPDDSWVVVSGQCS